MVNKNQKQNGNKYRYKSSGVDISAGNNFVREITPLAESTNRKGTLSNIGGFAALFDLKGAGYIDPILVAATDGVGTKLKIAVETRILDFVGIDLVAMCVNDLICQGAEPLFFLDYIATGKLDIDASRRIISSIVTGCKEANTALIGGETAEMPGMYQNNEFDLAGFAIGAFNRGKEIPKGIVTGDTIIGLLSSGIHSNGFSLVRKIINDSALDLKSTSPFSTNSLGRELLEPTKIYVQEILQLLKGDFLKGIAHITGGGITENLPRILNDQIGAKIDISSWPLPEIFNWLFKIGNLNHEETLQTFNCGIGMIIIVDKDKKTDVLNILNIKNQTAFEIGEITDSGKLEYFGELSNA